MIKPRNFTIPKLPTIPNGLNAYLKRVKVRARANLTNSLETSKINVVGGRQRYLSPSLSTFQAFKTPFTPCASYMQYLWDDNGDQYLDLLAQNLTIGVGHGREEVVSRVMRQLDKMVHCTTMYYHESPVKAARAIIETTLPKSVKDKHEYVVHFVNSGSEAVDLAIQMSRAYTKNWNVLALRNSYHGLHGVAQAATGMSACKQHIPDVSGVLHVANPDQYRPIYETTDEYVDELGRVIEYQTPGKVAGFIFEQVQGYGGINVLPKGYWQKCAKHIRQAGGLIIADEVQSGFKRMGTEAFWSFEMFDDVTACKDQKFVKCKHARTHARTHVRTHARTHARTHMGRVEITTIDPEITTIDPNEITTIDPDEYPDIIVTAKALGNGLPIAAVIAKRDVAESIVDKRFFNTYGGNPTVCAAAQGVMEVVGEREFGRYVRSVGSSFQTQLMNVADAHSNIIGQVRGQGLMYGVEVVKDPVTKKPNPELAADIFEEMRHQGVIMGLGGLHKNVLRVMPPMCVTHEDAEFMGEVFNHACFKAREQKELSRNDSGGICATLPLL